MNTAFPLGLARIIGDVFVGKGSRSRRPAPPWAAHPSDPSRKVDGAAVNRQAKAPPKPLSIQNSRREAWDGLDMETAFETLNRFDHGFLAQW